MMKVKKKFKSNSIMAIFTGGKNTASLNKSKNLQNRKKLLLDHAIRK